MAYWRWGVLLDQYGRQRPDPGRIRAGTGLIRYAGDPDVTRWWRPLGGIALRGRVVVRQGLEACREIFGSVPDTGASAGTGRSVGPARSQNAGFEPVMTRLESGAYAMPERRAA